MIKYLILSYLFITSNILAQPEVQWQYTYDNGWWDYVNDMAVDQDGNVYVTGSSVSSNYPSTNYDWATVKLNKFGGLNWVKRIANPSGTDEAQKLRLDKDGNVWISGLFGSGNRVIKYDSSGTKLFQRDLSVSSINDLFLDDSGNVYLTGETNTYKLFISRITGPMEWTKVSDSSGSGRKVMYKDNRIYVLGNIYTDSTRADGIIMCFDHEANLIWKYIYSKPGVDEHFEDFFITGDNYIILTGYGTDQYNQFSIVTKINLNGELIWAKRYDFNEYEDTGIKIAIDPSGNIVAAGIFSFFVPPGLVSKSLFIQKIDPDGSLLLSKEYYYQDHYYQGIRDLNIDTAGNIYCFSYTLTNNGSEGSYLDKFDYEGNLIYTFPFPNSAYPGRLILFNEDNFILGHTNYYGTSRLYDYSVIRYGYLVDLSQNEYSPDQYELKYNYPNPFNPSTVIEYSIPERQFVTLKVYDLLGKEISMLVNEFKNEGKHSVLFTPGTELPAGIYFYKITAENYCQTRKMIYLK